MDLFTAKGAIEVDEPRLYKETFPYDDFPKDVFIEGTYPYDIALTKVQAASRRAKEEGFPFRMTVEEA